MSDIRHGIVWIIGALAASMASAQDAPAPAETELTPATIPVSVPANETAETHDGTTKRGNSRLVQEIVVTAQKREENLQDVPISVQAFSAELLDARGITDQKELPLITPGLDIGTQVSYTTVFLRGVGTDAFLTADPSVATYIDSIYFPFAQGLTQDFGAVERVEVLKGPQGTLFGRNATGGALNVITERPDFDGPAGAVQLSAADYPDFQSRAHVNVPLSETVAISVSALYNQSEWYVDGIAGGKPLPDDTTKGVRGKIRWRPADWMDLTLSALKVEVDGAGSNFTPHHEFTPLGEALMVEPAPPYGGELDTPIFNVLDNTVVYGQVEFFTPQFDVKILGSHQDIDTTGWYDFDGSVQPLVSFLPPKNFSRVDSTELQLLSNDSSWGADWFQWIVGAYYFHGLSGFEPILGYAANLNSGVLAGQLSPGLSNTITAIGSLLDPFTVQGTPHLYLEGTLATNSVAAFAQTTFKLSEWLSLTLGGRFQSERRSIDKSTTGVQVDDLPPTTLMSYDYALDSDGARVGPRDTSEELSPKVSVELRPLSDDTLIYVSYQRAVKSSTYNTTAITGPPSYVRPETITAYEVGMKTALFEGLMRLDTAAWYYDIDDLQVQFFALANGGIVSFENAPRARTYGFEYGISTPLFPDRIDDLVLLTGAAYIDAEYKRFPNASGFQEPDFIFNQNIDVSGNRIVRAPEFTGNASLSKTWAMPGGALELTGDYYYNSGFFLEATNVERTHQTAFNVVGARISYLYEPWNARITIFGKNLTEELYSQGGLPNDFGDAINYAPPRTYGMRFNWEF